MPAIAQTNDDIMSIGEICYRIHRTRGQAAIWRGKPGFPEPKKTLYGHIGYSWREVVAWMIANRYWIRHRAGDPSLDELVASITPPSPNVTATDDQTAASPLSISGVMKASPTNLSASCDKPDCSRTSAGDALMLIDQHSVSKGCALGDLRNTD